MYGLPADFDSSFFIGHTLELVCFSENQMSLHFDEHISITIEGSFSYIKDKKDKVSVVEIPVTNSDVMMLTGKTIKESVGKRDGTLTLTFNNGHKFICYDDTPNYESYKIQNSDKEIIV
ncbi:MAG: DUF6188 family protein [Planctomycetota bacterium]